ncbi:MAG: universal stress protein [Kofleriaceae bacterium]
MPNSTSQVVVAYDFTQSGRAALHRAIALANRDPSFVLQVICAIDPHGQVPPLPHSGRVDYQYAEQVQAALTDEMKRELALAEITDRVHFAVHARIGKPAEEILALAREIGADLVIIGSKGAMGLERWVLGSVSEHVVREAGCTVEVARPKTYEHVKLQQITEHPSDGSHYVPPHRYTYDAHLNLRPADWPLY